MFVFDALLYFLIHSIPHDFCANMGIGVSKSIAANEQEKTAWYQLAALSQISESFEQSVMEEFRARKKRKISSLNDDESIANTTSSAASHTSSTSINSSPTIAGFAASPQVINNFYNKASSEQALKYFTFWFLSVIEKKFEGKNNQLMKRNERI